MMLGRMIRNYGGRIVLEVDSSTIRDKLLSLKAMEMTYDNGTLLVNGVIRLNYFISSD